MGVNRKFDFRRDSSFAGAEVMLFQKGIGSLGGTVFFQVGLCTPLQTMRLGRVMSKKLFLQRILKKNIWQKARKSSKIGQDQKSLIFVFA